MPFFGRLRSWILSQGQGGSELILLINIRYVEACNVLLVQNLDELSLCFPSPARASSFQDWSSYEMFGAFLTNWGQRTKPFVHCPQTEIISKLLKELAYSPWCLVHCTCRCCGQQGLSYLIPTQIQKLQWSHVTFCRGGWGRLSLCSNCSRYLFGPDFCCCGQERGERWVNTSSNTPFQAGRSPPSGNRMTSVRNCLRDCRKMGRICIYILLESHFSCSTMPSSTSCVSHSSLLPHLTTRRPPAFVLSGQLLMDDGFILWVQSF